MEAGERHKKREIWYWVLNQDHTAHANKTKRQRFLLKLSLRECRTQREGRRGRTEQDVSDPSGREQINLFREGNYFCFWTGRRRFMWRILEKWSLVSFGILG